MTRSLALAAVLALAGCVTMPDAYPKARAGIDRVEAASELAIARLPEPARSRPGAALILADAALAVIRSDAAPLARAAAARQLVRAVAILAGISSPPLAQAAGPVDH